jgi:hypothetical protein
MATFVTLLLVPVLFAIAAKDLQLVRWESRSIPAMTGGTDRP